MILSAGVDAGTTAPLDETYDAEEAALHVAAEWVHLFDKHQPESSGVDGAC